MFVVEAIAGTGTRHHGQVGSSGQLQYHCSEVLGNDRDLWECPSSVACIDCAGQRDVAFHIELVPAEPDEPCPLSSNLAAAPRPPCTFIPELSLTPRYRTGGDAPTINDAIFIEDANNYSEDFLLEVTALVPLGEPDAGDVACCFNEDVLVFEDAAQDWKWVSDPIKGSSPLLCDAMGGPFGGEMVPAYENGAYDAGTGVLLPFDIDPSDPLGRSRRFTLRLADGHATCLLKTLAYTTRDTADPVASYISAVARAAPATPGTNNPIALEPWADNVHEDSTGSHPGIDGNVDWLDRHFWNIVRDRARGGQALEQILATITSMDDDLHDAGPSDLRFGSTLPDGYVSLNRRHREFRLPFVRNFQAGAYCDPSLTVPEASCKFGVGVTLHEARHAWQYWLCRQPLSSLCASDDGPLPLPNDDDPGSATEPFPYADMLPEEAVLAGTCDPTPFIDAYADASPLVDPDGPARTSQHYQVPIANTESVSQSDVDSHDRRECDAQQFGREHRGAPWF